MVPEAIFIVKFNTRLKRLSNFYSSPLILWQGCQIVNIDVSLVRFIEYLRSEVLFVGLGSHFLSEIQRPASEKVWKFHLSAHNLWRGCQIAIVDVPLNRSRINDYYWTIIHVIIFPSNNFSNSTTQKDNWKIRPTVIWIIQVWFTLLFFIWPLSFGHI